MGRPKVPKSEAKSVLRGALFAPDEAETVDRTIKESGLDKSKWIREKLIDASIPYQRRFPVDCSEAKKKYDEQPVIFRIEINGELKGYLGKFIVHRYYPDPFAYVSVELEGFRLPTDPPNTAGYSFHLSQAHLDSIIPVSDPEAKFEIQIPFLARHHIPNASPLPGSP